MYYPLLRARQFELIALRELALEGQTQQFVRPILEPVRDVFNNLNLAHRVFQETGQQAFIIVNPIVGDSTGDSNIYLDYINDLEGNVLLPAFHYRGNSEYIASCIRDYNLSNCMLICQNDINPENPNFQRLVELNEITYINIEDPGRNRTLLRYTRRLEKSLIRLDDLFEKQTRNGDYLEIAEHLFSEEHIYFSGDSFNGFSDYTVLPSQYINGGITPRSVVIHFTYFNEQNQIMIRHFTSESNPDSIANVQGKFSEAASKTIRFCHHKGLTNTAITELESYFDRQHYPGLGTVKKISIKNHILIVVNYLNCI